MKICKQSRQTFCKQQASLTLHYLKPLSSFQDLCDRLYDICDNRKELAEKERQSVMSEGWLEDRLGLLTNFYVTLMQAEVDRYQDTVRLLRDYYVGMEGEPLC